MKESKFKISKVYTIRWKKGIRKLEFVQRLNSFRRNISESCISQNTKLAIFELNHRWKFINGWKFPLKLVKPVTPSSSTSYYSVFINPQIFFTTKVYSNFLVGVCFHFSQKLQCMLLVNNEMWIGVPGLSSSFSVYYNLFIIS